MTTYLAKQIIGSNIAATPAGALLQSGANRANNSATGDTWIFLNTVNSATNPWGIFHSQVDNKIKIIGDGTDDFWVDMDTGDTYVLGKIGIGYDPNTTGNNYKLYVNGSAYFNIGTSDNVTDLKFVINGNGRYLALGGGGIQARTSTDAVTTLYLNYNGGTTYVGGNSYLVGSVGIGYNPDTNGNTYKLYVNGSTNITGTTTLGDYLYRAYTASGQTPMIWMNSSDFDNYLWQIGSGTANGKQYYGYGLKYTGTGAGVANYLQLIADNQNGTDVVAIGINQSGQIGLGANANTSYRLYVSGTTWLNDHLYLAAGKHIYMNYNSTDYSVVHNHNNGNISVEAASGGLYIGYANTTLVNWMNGRMELRDGCLSLFPNNGSYREGIRIHATGSWSDITLCGNDNTGNSGTSANSWFLGNNNGNFYISRNGSSSGTSWLGCVGNVWKLYGNQTNSKSKQQSILHIYGPTYGNTAADMISGTAGLFSWGDGGPQITFDTSATPGGAQAGALIYTDHDTAATGASWHFVSNQSDWNVTSKRFHARTSISIGSNLPNTSYNLVVAGSTFHNGTVYFGNGTTYYINNSANGYLNNLQLKTNLTFDATGTTGTSGKITWSGSTDAADIYYYVPASDQGNLIINTRDDTNCLVAFAYNGTIKAYINNSTPSFYPAATNTGNIGTSTYEWGNTYTRVIYARHFDASYPYTSDRNMYYGYNKASNHYFYTMDGTTRTHRATLSSSLEVFTGNVWAGTSGSTAAERDCGARSGAGLIYLYSAAATNGNRGVYTNASPAGGGGARNLVYVTGAGRVYYADSYNGTATALAYSQSGLAASAITWLTCWNGYELRAISKAEMANAVDGSHKWVRLGGDTMTGSLTTQISSINASATNNGVSSTQYPTSFNICDTAGRIMCRNEAVIISDGEIRGYWYVRNYNTSGSQLFQAGILLRGFKNGTYRAESQLPFYGAVWNDYAEFRKTDVREGGRAIGPSGNLTTQRLEAGARIVSDTFGHAIGYMENDDTLGPVAISGRVLAYPYRNKNEYEIGDAVCSAPGGTVDIMTRDEIKEYPDRIIGIVNEIPDYDIWEPSRKGGGREPVHTNGRIWIDIK